MKKFALALMVLAVAALGIAATSTTAQAANATAGVVDVNGKPTLVIKGTKRIESVMVTAYSAIPENGNWDDPEVPIWSVSIIEGGLRVAADSRTGECWQFGRGAVYCKRDKGGFRSVIASLGGGIDSLIVDKSLQVRADGGPGSDSLYGGRKNDVLIGGPGRDMLQGEGGNDVLVGGSGDDDLRGDFWRDGVFGRPYAKPAGNDRIVGGPGRDTIQGGAGSDLLLGGPGSDWFENNKDRARDRIVGGGGTDSVRDPDHSRTGNGVAILDRISSSEFLYLGFTRYRLK